MSKKEEILTSALELFSERGFSNTSTSLIAKHAGVSEGLIFRHYETKEGLLKAILLTGIEHVQLSLEPLMTPKPDLKTLYTYIDGYTSLLQEHHAFWKLMSGLRLQQDVKKIIEEHFGFVNQKILSQLGTVFTNLGEAHPAMHALCFFAQLDGICMHYSVFGEQYPIREIAEGIKQNLKRIYKDSKNLTHRL